MKTISFITCASLLVASSSAFGAALITISFDSGGQFLRDELGALLTGGTTADGNGAVLQLGYYDGASTANNFLGNWVSLSGEGSLNIGTIAGSNPSETFNQTSIGDSNGNGAGNGQFALTLTFAVGDQLTGNSLPSLTSIPLAIRFFDSTTIASSDAFNVVSNDLWLWKTPAEAPNNPVINMSLDESNLEWQGGAGSEFKTTLAVPEPASTGLAVVGGMALLLRRRRRA